MYMYLTCFIASSIEYDGLGGGGFLPSLTFVVGAGSGEGIFTLDFYKQKLVIERLHYQKYITHYILLLT